MQRKKFWVNSACSIAAVFAFSQATISFAQPVLGGILEIPDLASVRNVLSVSALRNFLPERGVFQFPAPYNTQGIRLTNASDCGGEDCVNYAGYSYWRNMNNHVGMESMLVFLGFDRTRGGKGPSLLEVNKTTGKITDLGPLFPASHRLSWATGEGWHFSATLPTIMYVNDGPRIARLDVITGELQTIVDISNQFGKEVTITQMHTSDDDRVHSATVRDAQYRVMGCMAYDSGSKRYSFYPITDGFDECQVDRSGDWLLIKANLDGRNGEDNLIVNLRTGDERTILDEEGAAGHSDMGNGYMIASDNWAENANTWKVWDFNQKELKGKAVYHNKDWNVSAPDHVSNTNARAGVAADQQYACGSSVNRGQGVHANEIVCFTMDGSMSSVAVAPVMTDLNASGGDDEYGRYAKGNLDVTGQYFLWTTNLGGSRLDAFIVRIPDQLLTGTSKGNNGSGSYPSKPSLPHVPVVPSIPVVPPQSSSDQWTKTNNLTVAGNQATKTSGCDGCPDAGFIKEESVSGDAHMEFTVQSSSPLLYAGFTKSQALPDAESLVLSLRFQSGIAEVREGNDYKADIRYHKGDRFSITVSEGRVLYARNGTVFHSTPYRNSQRLYAGTVLYNIDAAVSDFAVVKD